MTGVLDDLKFGARMMAKRPGASALAALALALGIGLTTIMFSIVEGVVLRGLRRGRGRGNPARARPPGPRAVAVGGAGLGGGGRRLPARAGGRGVADPGRGDGRVGPTARYNLFRSVTEARDDDPDEEAFDALLALLAAMEQAHAALGTGGPDANTKVTGFEMAVLRLNSYNEASRRG